MVESIIQNALNLMSSILLQFQKYPKSFSVKYNLNKLVYYEHFGFIEEAIEREKQLKKWTRAKKEMLINDINPEWRDLYEEIL